jgi:shikimate kinase
LPGAGKSAVGRSLGRRLDLPFHRHRPCDRAAHRLLDPRFLRPRRRDPFRDLEQNVLADLAAGAEGVLATGGGAVLREANRSSVAAGHFHVIYLRSSPEDLAPLAPRHQAALAAGGGPAGPAAPTACRTRDPLYRETADDVVETGRPSVPMLVNMVMQLELAGIVAAGAHEEPGGAYTGPQAGMPKLRHATCPLSAPRVASIQLGDRSYPILIGTGLLDDPDLLPPRRPPPPP